MLKRLEITSAEQAKVLTHPLRLQIIHLFHDREPRTAKQIADILELAASKVHYHVRELVRVGLLELIETREKGGVLEKYYLPVAEEFRINLSEAKAESNEMNVALNNVIASLLDNFKRSFLKAVEDAEKRKKEREQAEETKTEKKIGPHFRLISLLLTDDEVNELHKELEELNTRWAHRCKERTAESNSKYKPHGMVLSLYQTDEKPRNSPKAMKIDYI